MGLLDRISARTVDRKTDLRHRDGQLSLNDWAEYFSFGGNTYPVMQTTMGQVDRESVGVTSVAGFKGNGPIFALVLARLQAFSQVRFQWTRFKGSQPGDLFGDAELGVLERPWRGGTTSDLLARMEVHASVAGCSYVTRPRRDRLSLLRPDRVTIIMGSETDEDDPSEAPDVEIVGYIHTTSRGRMTMYGPDQVAYYAPVPDPDYRFLGMSWITPVIRDLQADSLATEHKARFFTNAATPNLAIKFDASISFEKVKQFKALLESEHKGAFNAWKTLYLGGGADPVTVGSSFKDMDYAVIQGRAESRLAAAAGVPPSWVGFSEGLQGSSLNAGNFNSARRRFSDGTMIHLWTNASTSLEVLLSRPSGASLWFDPRVPFMREDAKDAAEIQQVDASTVVSLSTGGFTRDSSVAAVAARDMTLLRKDPDWVSVQLQQSAAKPPSPDTPAAARPKRALPGAGPKAAERKFNPAEPRDPDGKWSKVGALLGKLAKAGSGDHLQFSDGDYLDWATRKADGSFMFEAGDGHDSVVLDVPLTDLDDIHDDLTRTLADVDDGGMGLSDHDERSLYWEPLDEDGQRWELRVTDPAGDLVMFDWPRSRMEHLHHALTMTLLADALSEKGDADRAHALLGRLGQPSALPAGGAGPKALPAGRSGDDDELDEESLALLTALDELAGETVAARAWDEAKHKRNPKGTPGGGRFRSMVDRLKDAITEYRKGKGDGHPFDGFSREQLRRVAKARGIELKRGESRDSIATKLLDHLGGGAAGKPKAPKKTPPKKPSLNPPELTGREDRWWTVLLEDTGMDAVPVRDLELVGGYVLRSGKAYRVDGITFIVEDGTGDRAERVVQDFQEVHRQLPPEVDQYQRGYAWLAGRNPADGYWAKKYNMPGFRSAATAGDGAVRMWGRAGAPFGPASYLDSLSHEFGHNVSSAVAGRDLHDGSLAWARASWADSGIRRPTDVVFSGRLALRLRDVNFQEQPGKAWPWGVSEYGTSSRAEDYAESVAFYLGDRIGSGRLRPDGPLVPIYFRDLFPARAKVLDQVFPEIAKRQKAAVSAR